MPYGLYGVGGCVAALGVLILKVMRMGHGDSGAPGGGVSMIQCSKAAVARFRRKIKISGTEINFRTTGV